MPTCISTVRMQIVIKSRFSNGYAKEGTGRTDEKINDIHSVIL